FYNSIFCFFPRLVATDIFFFFVRIAERNLCCKLFESKSLEHIQHQIYYFQKLILYLVRTAENMGIILGKSSHPCEAMQLATLFISVNRSKFCQSQWKIFIRPWFGLIYLTMVRTIHGLQQKLLAFVRCKDRLK